jgi:hypothetical protein
VPGGIPNRTTIYTTLNPGATAAQINTAIANCPSNRVVYLSAGTYNVGAINLATRNGVTLRGAGPGQTIINSTATSACIFSDQYGFGSGVSISSGYTKGSTDIVLSSASGFSAGNLIMMSQNDDTSLVRTSGAPGRHMEYMARITSVSGNTVTFAPPLPWGLSSTLAPQAAKLNGGNGLSWTGVEDMTINNLGGANDIIFFVGTYACWVKNVELTRAENTFVFLVSCLQNEVRHCYVHTAANFPANSDGYGVYVYAGTTYTLIEDNIFHQLAHGILQTASSANAYLFNYCRDITLNGWPYQFSGMNASHGAQPMMCLWEGNISEQFQADGYHGSASHQTLFRNWLHGLSNLGATGNRKMISAERGSYYFNVVGNVLGDASWTNASGFAYSMTGEPDYNSAAVIYRLGYPNMSNNGTQAGDVAVTWPLISNNSYPDVTVVNTMLRHGNYDWKNRAIVWDSANSDHSIPASLFYTSKPAYFGNRPWPPFDPASPTSASITNIPAGYRYQFGVDPPAGGPTPPPAPTNLRVVGP